MLLDHEIPRNASIRVSFCSIFVGCLAILSKFEVIWESKRIPNRSKMHPTSEAARQGAFEALFFEKSTIFLPSNEVKNHQKRDPKTSSKITRCWERFFLDFLAFSVPKMEQKTDKTLGRRFLENHGFTVVKPMFLRSGTLQNSTLLPFETRSLKRHAKKVDFHRFGLRFGGVKRLEKRLGTRLVSRCYGTRAQLGGS